jgi:hypothetical protein
MGGYGFSSLNKNLNSKNNNTNLLEVSSLSSLITAVRVIYILLDDSDPIKFKKYGGWNGLGTIEYESITSLGTTSFAFPLYSNLKNYPLINEIVYTISFPSTSIGKANTSERKYYLNTISLWNHPHHNAYPSIANEPDPPQQKDYIQTQLGSAKIITDENKQISLGKTFYERSNIHPLLPFEGDVIQEGRWGNSIRLGSTVGGSPSPTITNDWSNSGTNGDPITIIRNGQGQQTEEGWIPITEDINNDESSIYLSSNQIIPLKASSTNYVSYEGSGYEAPSTPDKFNSKQIILSSGRLVFNSSNDNILLSSAKSIDLNSKASVNITADKFIVQSNNTYLGNIKLATEPLMLGKKTTDVLRDLINKLTPLVTALQSIQTAPTVPGAPVVFLNLIEPTTNLLIVLNSLSNELGASSANCTLISKNNFTV